jgi:hypothetical protein
LSCNSETGEILTSALAASIAPPFKLAVEQSLANGQVSLRLGDQERHVDMEAALIAVQTAVESYFETEEELKQHA